MSREDRKPGVWFLIHQEKKGTKNYKDKYATTIKGYLDRY
jgi:hypothetical protein